MHPLSCRRCRIGIGRDCRDPLAWTAAREVRADGHYSEQPDAGRKDADCLTIAGLCGRALHIASVRSCGVDVCHDEHVAHCQIACGDQSVSGLPGCYVLAGITCRECDADCFDVVAGEVVAGGHRTSESHDCPLFDVSLNDGEPPHNGEDRQKRHDRDDS